VYSILRSPFPVIVEEAAEVLESHIITSITQDCQHLVLIGKRQNANVIFLVGTIALGLILPSTVALIPGF
jgi:hypothetical protein